MSPLLLLAGCILTEKARVFEECTAERPDAVTTTDPTCVDATTASLDLRAVWSSTDLATPMTVSATRSSDLDGDGDVDGGDPMQLWAVDAWESVAMIDHTGTLAAEFPLGAHRAYGYAGDLDPDDAGSEYFTSWYVRNSVDSLASAMSETAESWSASHPVDREGYPFLTDLEDDGVPEVIVGGQVLSGVDGTWIATLDGTSADNAFRAFAADLDRDGVREILGGVQGRSSVVLYEADGAVRSVCYDGPVRGENVAFAVGNFDADDDAEFVAAGTRFVALCDTDGTLIASHVDATIVQPNVMALGQLDADPELEIVFGDSSQLWAFEHDLTPRWTYTGDESAWHVPALADLDLDGRHEVVDVHGRYLAILDGDANVLEALAVTAGNGSSWMTQPVVADVDADGLAEIVVPAYGELTVLENEHGGWSIPEARYPWPGHDRHPAQQDVDGSMLPASAWWLEEGGNVFNGVPAGPARIPDLAVAIEDVCVQCDGESAVVIAVSNVGAGAAMGEVDVVVRSTGSGDELARASVPTPLKEGVTRYVVVPVPSGRLGDGLTVTAATDDQVGECDTVDNAATWDASPCLD